MQNHIPCTGHKEDKELRDIFTRYYLFLIYDHQDEYDEVIEELSAYIISCRTNSAAFNNRATAYWETGKIEKALEDLRTSIMLCQENTTPFHNRARIYEYLGKHDEAVADYTAAIQLSGGDRMAYTNRAKLYFECGDFQQAIEDYTNAITLDPKQPYTYEQRAKVHDRLSQTESAATDREAARQAQEAIDLRKARKRNLAEGFVCPDTGTRFKNGSMIGEWGEDKECASAEWNSHGPILRQDGVQYKFNWQGVFIPDRHEK